MHRGDFRNLVAISRHHSNLDAIQIHHVALVMVGFTRRANGWEGVSATLTSFHHQIILVKNCGHAFALALAFTHHCHHHRLFTRDDGRAEDGSEDRREKLHVGRCADNRRYTFL